MKEFNLELAKKRPSRLHTKRLPRKNNMLGLERQRLSHCGIDRYLWR